MTKTKKCTKCGNRWLATTRYFYVDIRRKDGLANPCKHCKRKYEETSRAKQLDANRHLKYRYEITIGIYDSLYIKQSGRCGVCNKHQSMIDNKLDVDHDHKTGKVRGLVCNQCNRLIGCYEHDQIKNPIIANGIKKYLSGRGADFGVLC